MKAKTLTGTVGTLNSDAEPVPHGMMAAHAAILMVNLLILVLVVRIGTSTVRVLHAFNQRLSAVEDDAGDRN